MRRANFGGARVTLTFGAASIDRLTPAADGNAFDQWMRDCRRALE
jgi:hypothetical protein